MQRAYKPVCNMVEMTDVTLQMPRFHGIRTQAVRKTDTMLYHPSAEVLVEVRQVLYQVTQMNESVEAMSLVALLIL